MSAEFWQTARAKNLALYVSKTRVSLSFLLYLLCGVCFRFLLPLLEFLQIMKIASTTHNTQIYLSRLSPVGHAVYPVFIDRQPERLAVPYSYKNLYGRSGQ